MGGGWHRGAPLLFKKRVREMVCKVLNCEERRRSFARFREGLFPMSLGLLEKFSALFLEKYEEKEIVSRNELEKDVLKLTGADASSKNALVWSFTSIFM